MWNLNSRKCLTNQDSHARHVQRGVYDVKQGLLELRGRAEKAQSPQGFVLHRPLSLQILPQPPAAVTPAFLPDVTTNTAIMQNVRACGLAVCRFLLGFSISFYKLLFFAL